MPRTNWDAYVPVTSGSSPGVSSPRPQRGSRNMFTVGAQKVSPPVWPTLFIARPSTPMAAPIARHRLALNALLDVTAIGKDVVELIGGA